LNHFLLKETNRFLLEGGVLEKQLFDKTVGAGGVTLIDRSETTAKAPISNMIHGAKLVVNA